MLRRLTATASAALLPPSSLARTSAHGPNTDPLRNLARWLEQIEQDATGFSFDRLIKETPYSRLFWRMWLRGVERRLDIGYTLNSSAHFPVASDPRRPLPFSWPAPIAEACAILGIEPLIATYGNHARQVADDISAAEKRRVPIYAWMNTYAERRAAELLTIQDDDVPKLLYWLPDGSRLDMPLWVFQAACCLAIYDRNSELYNGYGAPGDRILPPDPVREPLWTPILHNYAKGLLSLDRSCPPRFGCACNTVLAITDQPPPSHPEATGVLPPIHDPREDEVTRTSGSYGSSGPGLRGRPASPTRPLHEHNGHNGHNGHN